MRRSILIILPFFPYPIVSGGHLALFNSIISIKDDYDVFLTYTAADSKAQHEAEISFKALAPTVTLFPQYQFESKKKRILKKIRKAIVYVGRALSIIEQEDNDINISKGWIGSILPLQKDWLIHIEKLCASNSFDIIQVEMPWIVSQVLSLPNETKKVFVHHELGFVRRDLELSAMHKNNFLYSSKRFADINEVSLLNMYNGIITLSPIDTEKLKMKGVTVPIYSSFVPIDSNNYDDEINLCDGTRITFVGPSCHTPNYEGITWFLENCWNRLLSENNNYSLDIIGIWDKEHAKEYKKKYHNVHFLGYVENLSKVLRNSILIVPIKVGSGIRMKILEASSIGVPIVSTTIGAEGIPVIDGRDCFIADTPNDFSDKIIKLRD